MRDKREHPTVRTALVFVIVFVLVWGGIPAPALANLAEEVASEDVAAQSEGGQVREFDAEDAPAVEENFTEPPVAAEEGVLVEEGGGTAEGKAFAEGESSAGGAALAAEEVVGVANSEVLQEVDKDAALSAQADAFALGAQSVSVSNPRVVANSSMTSRQVATWDCVWFGSYPQSEVKQSDADYASLESAEWDANGDATVGGRRYRRISRDDAMYSEHWLAQGYGDATYRYFRYEPIKWRVLEVNGSGVFVFSDVALDDQRYNTNETDVTWETCSVRSWLNGYGASSNQPETDYSSKNFVNTAFSSAELDAVLVTTVVNANNTFYGTAGGKDTQDKVFLLSEAEIQGSTETAHCFASNLGTSDEARRCKATDYVSAMGSPGYDGGPLDGNCWWWLRSPGRYTNYGDCVEHNGSDPRIGYRVCDNSRAVRPALNLDLSSSLVHYAGTVSSDGTVDEVGLIQITSVELDKTSYTYDGQNRPAVAVLAGDAYVPSDGYDVSYSNNSGVGTAAVTVTGKGPYAGEVSVEFQIEPKPVTVTAEDKHKALGAADPELTATVDGLIGADTITYDISRETGEACGEYAIMPTGAAAQGNYAVAYVSGKLLIRAIDVWNPRVVANTSLTSGQVATWDCVWFGSYPQTEVKPSDAAYASLQSASWDASGNATVGGTKYRRISKNDATNSDRWKDDGYDSAAYRYFRYEPIKWRVLEVDGNTALVVSDVALDDQCYNKNYVNITWETSSVRSWLNGYGASSNEPRTDYSSKNFMGTAFSSAERDAVSLTAVANANNTYYGTYGGNDTQDKVFLLSEAEVHGSSATIHGFASDPGTYDEARYCRPTDYARAMGAYVESEGPCDGNCWWLLRSPGGYANFSVDVNTYGDVYRHGFDVSTSNDVAIRPALNLDLSSSLAHYAGTVSSDGALDEEGYIQITSVELGEVSYTYDGQNTPAVAVLAGDAYVPSDGYDVSYSNNAGIGTATVTVTGKSPYTGVASAEFQITPKPVTVTADDQSKVFGEADPVFTATVEGLVGTDTVTYTVSRATGEDVGDYAITPSGDATQGNYSVTYVPGKLTITKASVERAEVAPIPNQIFTGSAIKPAVAVTLDGHELDPSTDYDVAYTGNVNAGTATATVTGKGNYEGTKDNEFQIAPKPVTVTAVNKSKVFGEADPTLTATVDGTVGTDTVTYTVSRATGEDVGDYAITPSGDAEQDNYSVTYVPGKLTVCCRGIANAQVAAIPEQTFTGSALEPKPVVTWGGTTLREGADYELSYTGNVNTGTATATITGKGNYEGTKDVEFQIKRASVEVPTAKDGLVYSGESQTGVEAGKGYVLEGDSTATDAGSYTATATPDANHAWPDGTTGARELSWSIARKAVTVRGRETTKEFGATDPAASKLAGVEGLLGNDTVTFVVSREQGEALGDYVTTPAGAAEQGNYVVTYVPGKLTIVKADVAGAEIASIDNKLYTGSTITPLPVVSMHGKPLALGADYTLSYANNVEPGTATVTVTGKGNYAGAKSATFRIMKTGWSKEGSAWYYYGADGNRAKGWQKVGDFWYYLEPASGAMKSGWLKDGGKWYYLDPANDSRMATGWRKVGNYWYLFASEGQMLSGWQKSGNSWYYLNPANDSRMATGWRKVGGWWYLFAAGGQMLSGWQKSGNSWYYLDPANDSRMATGWRKVGSYWYLFAGGGQMFSGWQKSGNSWYYLNPANDSRMATGWLKIGGTWYYFNGSGIMVTGRQNIGGKWYTFNSNGAWIG